MLKNYFKIAWRNAINNRARSLINLFGLTMGLTCVTLIGLFIKNEFEYDRHFTDADRIFRVNVNGKMGEEEFYAGYTPPPAGRTLMENFPEIESYTRIYRPGQKVLRTGGDSGQQSRFTESGILSVDSNFLQVLDYPLSAGDRKTCLLDPHSIIVSEAMARKYFGKADPMGRTLYIEGDDHPYTVRGILAGSRDPSSLKFDFLVPIANAKDVSYFDWSWVWLNVATYVKFSDQVQADAAAVKKLESKFPAMIRQHAAGAFDRIGQPYDEFLEKGNKWDLSLQPLKAIHLHSGDIVSTVTDQGSIKTVYFFAVTAIFVLLLACVNFMNLSTAGASRRAKEIGVRKVLGSTRKEVGKQFFAEALVFSAFAGMTALVLVRLSIPWFNQLAGKTLAFGVFWTDWNWLYFMLLVLACALLAGSYPAFYLSTFKPLSVLKGQGTMAGNSGNKGIRSGLIVFQFSVSVALMICTLVVYQQLRYTQVHDLGLDKENVIILPNSNRLGAKENSFRDEVKKLSSVVNASVSTGLPGKGAFGDFYVPLPSEGDQPAVKDIILNSYLTDTSFIKTLGISIVSGRGFDAGFDHSRAVLVNETAARQLGYRDPVGKYLKYPGGNAAESYQIVGVMNDFHTESLHQPITPFALFHESSQSYDIPFSSIAVRVRPGDLSPVLKDLAQLWESFSPAAPFEYSFLRDDLAMQYESDQRTAEIIGVFSLLSIVIACTGLLGLVIFATQQRTKEIGIRKVLGASVAGVVALLSKDFIKLVLTAVVMAIPVAWYAMDRWLEDFAYRIELQWWMFALAGLLAVVIALLTVCFQSVKAALMNPVKSLRSE